MTETDYKRRIRSFVRREGRLTKGQQRALHDLLPSYSISLEQGCLDLDALFGRHAPHILEIGFGNGASLAAMAAQHPEQDYLGIEVHRPGVGNLLLQVEKLGLTNIRVSSDDAVEVIAQQIPDASLDAVYLFFPDPWHKKKHHKRRIVQASFTRLIRQKLKIGGLFHLATDWENYAEHMMEVLSASEGFVNMAGQRQFTPRPDFRPLTRFEQRGERLGHDVWDLTFKRAS